MAEYLSFELDKNFVDTYKNVEPNWGFPIGGGNSLGEITYLRTYSRLDENGDFAPAGEKERWYQTCQRVIEGMYSIMKDHCMTGKTPWKEDKAQRSAQEAYDRMFNFKWLPPGRGIWMMGTRFVAEEGSSSLQNCSHLSSRSMADDPALIFERLMEQSMLGVGVGYDTDGAELGLKLAPENEQSEPFVIDDSRQGWYESLGALIRYWFNFDLPRPEFDYSQIRPKGSPIKRFGGIAPGPQPLIDLHKDVDRICRSYAETGRTVDSRFIVDIANLVGVCVISGNVRRSALLSLGDADDKDFINLKRYDLPENEDRAAWGWMSNNSVKATIDDDLSHLTDSIAVNGEPGIIWLDLARQYGRLSDPLNNIDHRVSGVNPCQPAWAPVITEQGISTIGKISPGDKIWSETGWTTVVDKWSTGMKPVFQYETTAGRFYGTENHRLVSGEEKIPASECDVVDLLSGPENIQVDKWDPQVVMDGLVFGDGTVHAASSNLVLLNVGGHDSDYFNDPLLVRLIKDRRPGVGDFVWEVETTIEPSEIPKTYERRVPDRFFYADQSTVAAFLRGLYSANGSVVGKGRVTLKASSRDVIERVQIMLSSLGIRSYYTTNLSSKVMFSNGEYECKESYDLNISVDRARFARMIGFVQEYKNEKLQPYLEKSGRTKTSFDVKSVTHLGDEEVFDITVDNDPHTYWTGGLNVSNCSEQSLENFEMCTLVESFPTNHESIEDFLRTLKFAYLYGKAVTLLPTHWPETNEVMTRNRRIGTSISGLAEFVEKKGWGELRNWMDTGYNEVRKWDHVYSEWLGVRESIKTTTIKPSGTVSILSGCTPGVHWPTHSTYVRRIRFGDNDPMVPILIDAGYHAEYDKFDSGTVIVSFPVRGNDVRVQEDVSIWEKAELAALAQAWWSDNMVSCTLSFKEEEKGQVGPVIDAFSGRFKSISFLPITEDGAYEQMPYEAISDIRYEDLAEEVSPLNLASIYGGNALDAAGESGCTTDICELKSS